MYFWQLETGKAFPLSWLCDCLVSHLEIMAVFFFFQRFTLRVLPFLVFLLYHLCTVTLPQKGIKSNPMSNQTHNSQRVCSFNNFVYILFEDSDTRRVSIFSTLWSILLILDILAHQHYFCLLFECIYSPMNNNFRSMTKWFTLSSEWQLLNECY